jgi:hypothetical protein
VKHNDKLLNTIISRIDELDKRPAAAADDGTQFRMIKRHKRGPPEVTIVEEPKDQESDDDSDEDMVDVEVSSMVGKGNGFKIYFTVDGEDRELSLRNFHNEFPLYVFENEYVDMFKKKYETLEDKDCANAKIMYKYIANANVTV